MKRPVYLVDFKVVVNEKTWYFMKVKVFMKKKNARMFIKEKNSHEGRNFNSFHIFLGGKGKRTFSLKSHGSNSKTYV